MLSLFLIGWTFASHKSTNKFPLKRVKYLAIPSSIFLSSFLIHRRALHSQPIRGKVRRTGRIFQDHVEWSFLDPEYSFVTVGRIPRPIFMKQKFAQLRTRYIRHILPTMFAHLRMGFSGTGRTWKLQLSLIKNCADIIAGGNNSSFFKTICWH